MNNKLFLSSGLKLSLIIVAALSIMISCKKVDDTYVHYQTKAGNFSGNALQYLQSQPGIYDSMLLAFSKIPRIADSVENNEVTLFAVSNGSFSLALQNINQARQDSFPSMAPVSIASIDSTVLDTFLCRYVLRGKHESKDIADFADGLFFKTIEYVNRNGVDTSYSMQMQYTRTNASGFVGGGPTAIIFSDPKGSIFFRYWVRVNTMTVDIKTSNAVVHLLPPGHDFGFGNEFVRQVNFR